MDGFDRESMLEMFTFEMSQLLEQLEQNIIQGESGYTMDKINEIFRIMHTIKGSAAMMMFTNISTAAHAIEDLFFYLREENPTDIDFSKITDLVLESLDFIKEEIGKIEAGLPSDGNCQESIDEIKQFLQKIKNEKTVSEVRTSANAVNQRSSSQSIAGKTSGSIDNMSAYSANIKFDDNCEMENVRAIALLENLKDIATDIKHVPEDVIETSAIDAIRKNGFMFNFYSDKSYDEVRNFLQNTIYLKELSLEQKDENKAKAVNIFDVTVYFEDDCEMDNVRAYVVVHNLTGAGMEVEHTPANLVEESSITVIKRDGLKLRIKTDKSFDVLSEILSQTLFLKDLIIERVKEDVVTVETPEPVDTNNTTQESNKTAKDENKTPAAPQLAKKTASGQHVISVNVNKLDELLKLMGELVISEAMVTQNPELEKLELDSFNKEARQLRKIIKDIQDNVMSMRMVPLSTTFFKMRRIVRDMCKQLGKDINLEIVGEETEVDKNIIEHISDPLMHIIRNSADHGIETPEERKRTNKNPQGTIKLEAKNSGSDVLIIVSDDGKGLDKEKILKKAKNSGLLKKDESEYSDKEIHQFVFMPGFSTNEKVTNFSGRGVGMDVVSKNLELVGGSVIVDSTPGEGSTFMLKIPLTLAIIEGMMVKMGGSRYTLPIISIKDSFKPKMEDIFGDPNGNEMITVRGECYNIVRLNRFFDVNAGFTEFESGIMILVENGEDNICLFVDELVGEHQIVVKSLPKYINRIKGISGCTLLGNGDISLIIDVAGFFDK